ncbi:dTDP-glucose 4,6-dehydratase [Oceanicaulis sp. HTCC2633]|uniref:dTDP-glucose 4,6-dehydratase n=1 Tax=Oceanicaulis sp. HTCC2633 TaxID=314254 RepID=UPI00058CE41C|nr:dTDP-glucose 4,6-dehydratase [Oceanicaulis sp. HTCC2633]
MSSERPRALVTGGAGFIGSALVAELIDAGWTVAVLDTLSYAAAPGTIALLKQLDHCTLVKGDIRDRHAVRNAFKLADPDVIFHAAAETHVDRSIDAATDFVTTNVIGTFELLEAARDWRDTYPERKVTFVHVSTDEVFGDLHDTGQFDEASPYAPSSPYSATKASSDHLVRAWARTYGLDVRISNCSNNYGPRQFPEKLIPLTILNALEGKPLPVYGDGGQVRDWLYVNDHARALRLIAEKGEASRTYCVGGNAEQTNLNVVYLLCDILDERIEKPDSHRELITFVSDRPGHDRRYAIDASRIKAELGWRPGQTFQAGLKKTVDWYLAHEDWWRPLAQHYKRERLGNI